MTVESALYPPQLNTAWPQASDMVSEGDNHIRLTKTVMKTTFPNVAGVVSATDIQLSYVTGVTSAIQAQIDSKGAIAGQTWTGTHVFPSTTTIGGLTPTIRGYLETVTSDAQAQIDAKSARAGDTYTGSHDFTGAVVDVATQTAGDSSTKAASTAFVAAAAFSSALPGQSGNAGKFAKTNGVSAGWDWPYLTVVPVPGTSVSAAAGNCYSLENIAATAVTLPATPADGDVVAIDSRNLLESNSVLRNGNLLMGLAEDMTIGNPYFPLVLRFRTGKGWGLAA